MNDLFGLFDPMAYARFIDSAKGNKRHALTSSTAPLKVLVGPYKKFAKRSRSWPDADLIMTDAGLARIHGAFLRHPVADEIAAGLEPDDLIFVRLKRGSIEYRLVRPMAKGGAK